MPAFNLNKGNQTAQNRIKLQKEQAETEDLAMPDARRVPIEKVRPNPFQVRQDFDSDEAQAALQELAEDIRQRDVLEPLIVRPVQEKGEEHYLIVAGERRYQAAKIAKKTHLPVIIKENWTERDARLASLAENLQRRNLSLLEEVQFFQALENEYNYSARKIAQLISKSESYVSRRLRLAANPDKLAALSEKGMTITEALVSQEEPAETPTPDTTTSENIPSENGTASATRARQVKQAQSIRLVTFSRFRLAIDKLSKQLEATELAKAERDMLVEELEQIEQGLSQLRASLTASSRKRK
ncbi:MAG TPA: ParB/RepB/Spo0J family partition protein [Chloroflexia bacterium]|nr:ParB/RepB/Spo0J family partition protein [Chloroflexia bacterium]